jgi:hypothetical protein
MKARTIVRMARPMKSAIGAHYRMIGNPDFTNDAYQEAQRRSDEAVQLAKYLIMHLDNRHDAVQLAHAVGMPGYINLR